MARRAGAAEHCRAPVKGARFQPDGLDTAVDYYAIVVRADVGLALLDPPTTICASWHPSEDPDLRGDDEEFAIELNLHERGWRMCQCYSRRVPDGEFGHLVEQRLLAIPQADFEEALGFLKRRTCRSTRSVSTTPLPRRTVRRPRATGRCSGRDVGRAAAGRARAPRLGAE